MFIARVTRVIDFLSAVSRCIILEDIKKICTRIFIEKYRDFLYISLPYY